MKREARRRVSQDHNDSNECFSVEVQGSKLKVQSLEFKIRGSRSKARFFLVAALAVCFGESSRLPAAIIGTNPPAQAVSAERIRGLPAGQQGAWGEYLQRSERQALADHAFFAEELRAYGMKETAFPPESRGFGASR